MSQESKIEAGNPGQTTDFLPSGGASYFPSFIADARKWCEEIVSLSDGEVVCKLADMLAENHALKTQLAAYHKALMVCDGAMMGKVNPKSVAFKMVNAILRQENASAMASADEKTPPKETTL